MVFVQLVNAVVIGIAGYQIIKTAQKVVKGINLSEAVETLQQQKSNFSSTFSSVRSSFRSTTRSIESESTLQCITSCACDSNTTSESDVSSVN